MPGSHSENVPSAPAQPFYSSMPGAATQHCVSPTRTQFQGGRPASTIMLEVHLPILAPDYTPDCTAAQGQGSTLGLGLFIHSQQSSEHLGSAGCEGLIGCAWAQAWHPASTPWGPAASAFVVTPPKRPQMCPGVPTEPPRRQYEALTEHPTFC